MNKFTITLKDSDDSFTCYESENVLKGMARLGCRGIPVGCRNGGCGVCKIKIHSGIYNTGLMSREQVSHEEEKDGLVLACRVMPQSDLVLSAVGKEWNKFLEYGVNN